LIYFCQGGFGFLDLFRGFAYSILDKVILTKGYFCASSVFPADIRNADAFPGLAYPTKQPSFVSRNRKLTVSLNSTKGGASIQTDVIDSQ